MCTYPGVSDHKIGGISSQDRGSIVLRCLIQLAFHALKVFKLQSSKQNN